MITGLNLLKVAMNMIPHTSIYYRRYEGASVNKYGVTVQTYTEPKTVNASVQPGIVSSFGGKNVELKDYKELGLDWSRRHITVWMPDVGLETNTDKDGSDVIEYLGRTFIVLHVENWLEYDGWIRVYCVEQKS